VIEWVKNYWIKKNATNQCYMLKEVQDDDMNDQERSDEAERLMIKLLSCLPKNRDFTIDEAINSCNYLPDKEKQLARSLSIQIQNVLYENDYVKYPYLGNDYQLRFTEKVQVDVRCTKQYLLNLLCHDILEHLHAISFFHWKNGNVFTEIPEEEKTTATIYYNSIETKTFEKELTNDEVLFKTALEVLSKAKYIEAFYREFSNYKLIYKVKMLQDGEYALNTEFYLNENKKLVELRKDFVLINQSIGGKIINNGKHIFINYRKEDSKGYSLALYRELIEWYGKHNIFKDFIDIEPGEDFEEVINNALSSCSILLVIIGDRWNEIMKQRQMKNESSDFVRLEIAFALSKNIYTIPVTIDSAIMPTKTELPDDLKKLTGKQYLNIDQTRFETDTMKLVQIIDKRLGIERKGKYE
jgi:hypothetical protein